MIKNKRGFTLIELLIVMIIIGILVLLATPKFLNFIEKAKYTNIINDIKVVESVSLVDISLKNKLPEGSSTIPVNNFKNEIKNREVYLKDGQVVWDLDDNYKPLVGDISKTYGTDLNSFYKLSKSEFVNPNTNTRLKGDFYINKDGVILYVKSSNILNPEPEDKEELSKNYDMFRYESAESGKIIGINYSHNDWEIDKEGYRKLPEIPKYRKTKEGKYVEITEITDKAFPSNNPSQNIVFRGELKAPYIKKVGEITFLNSQFTGDFYMPNVEEIGYHAFINSKFDGSFKAPKLKVIGGHAFKNSTFTKNFNAENIVTIDEYAFLNSKFTGELNAPKLETIKKGAFENSQFKGDFKLDSIKNIGEGVFLNAEFGPGFYAKNIEHIQKDVFYKKYVNTKNSFTKFIPDGDTKDNYNRSLKEAITEGLMWYRKDK